MQADEIVKKRVTPTDWMRRRFKGVLDAAAGGLIKLGLTPNLMTGLGFAVTVVGALFLSQGQMTIGGLFILIAGILLTFRFGRFFLPRQRESAKPTQYSDAWAESAKRIELPNSRRD